MADTLSLRAHQAYLEAAVAAAKAAPLSQRKAMLAVMLADAFADIGGTVDSETVEREVGTWFLGLGVALLVATAALSLLWFNRLP